MQSKIISSMDRITKKPLYRLSMAILGFPTFIACLVVYLVKFSQSKKHNKKQHIKDEILANIGKDGTKTRIEEEAKLYLNNKYNFFNKKINENDFKKELSANINTEIEKIVSDKMKDNKGLTESDLNFGFMNVLKNLLSNNLFLVFSIISSFPMYFLLLIYVNPYAKYIFERLTMMVFVIFGVVFLVFTILYMSPLDPAVNILGQTATPEQVAEFNRVYELDQPYGVQLFHAFKGLLTFDLGRSYSGNELVLESITRKFPVTLQLTFTSLFVAIIIAIPAGIISAVKQYSSFDYIFMLLALLGLSIPNFWLGLILILNFSINLGWLPATYSAANAASLIMPSIVLGTSLAASVARMTRSSMLEVIKQDYIVTARAKGLSRKKVVLKHALGNAMIPIVTVIGLQFGGMLGGSAVTEKVFNVNGIGSYIVDKQFVPDIPVVLAGVVYVAVIISIANLFVDILYAFLDPRIKSKMKSY